MLHLERSTALSSTPGLSHIRLISIYCSLAHKQEQRKPKNMEDWGLSLIVLLS
ncbi:hypothetical protein Hdeb2414_s0266g00852351 [Helianthus debilis subsp. tardiflorus]